MALAALPLRLQRWGAGLLRTLFVSALMLFAICASVWHSAEAQLGEALIGVGAELGAWAPGRLHSAPRMLTLNGMQFGLVALSTELGPDEALDSLQEYCDAARPARLPRELGASLRAKLGRIAVLRHNGQGAAVLACITSRTPRDVQGLARALADVDQTGDVGALGQLFYVYARPSVHGTSLLALWSRDSGFDLEHMFPKGKDAPGPDPVGIPRPPGGRRLLSGRENGMPSALTAYVSPDTTPDTLKRFYQHALERRGWVLEQTGRHSLVAQLGDRLVVVALFATGAGHVAATIAELA